MIDRTTKEISQLDLILIALSVENYIWYTNIYLSDGIWNYSGKPLLSSLFTSLYFEDFESTNVSNELY